MSCNNAIVWFLQGAMFNLESLWFGSPEETLSVVNALSWIFVQEFLVCQLDSWTQVVRSSHLVLGTEEWQGHLDNFSNGFELVWDQYFGAPPTSDDIYNWRVSGCFTYLEAARLWATEALENRVIVERTTEFVRGPDEYEHPAHEDEDYY